MFAMLIFTLSSVSSYSHIFCSLGVLNVGNASRQFMYMRCLMHGDCKDTYYYLSFVADFMFLDDVLDYFGRLSLVLPVYSSLSFRTYA